MRTEPIAKPPVNPIKRIQEDILAFLEKRRGETFSSYQIVEGLRKQGSIYAIEYVQEAMGYLADAGRVKFQDRRYLLPSSE
jgi:hypothetical protein